MTIEIVNLRVSKYDQYIGRTGYTNCHFGNPFTFKENTLGDVLVANREEAVKAYEEWLEGDQKWIYVQPERRVWILNNLETLKGKKLGCFCAPLACHGDVLKKLVEKYCK